jgi:hypothetical protein
MFILKFNLFKGASHVVSENPTLIFEQKKILFGFLLIVHCNILEIFTFYF